MVRGGDFAHVGGAVGAGEEFRLKKYGFMLLTCSWLQVQVSFICNTLL